MYLVVVSYLEEETYFFNTKKEMFSFFNVNSINELLEKEDNIYSYAVVYKIEKVFEKI